MALRTVCPVTIPEEVRVQGCHRTSGKTQAQAINKVVGNEGIHRTQVEDASLVVLLVLMSHLHIVLHQRTDAEDDIFEALRVLHAMDKTVHRRFTLGQTHLSVLVPISLITIHGIHIMPYLRLTLEEHLWQRVEGIVGETRVAHHQ